MAAMSPFAWTYSRPSATRRNASCSSTATYSSCKNPSRKRWLAISLSSSVSPLCSRSSRIATRSARQDWLCRDLVRGRRWHPDLNLLAFLSLPGVNERDSNARLRGSSHDFLSSPAFQRGGPLVVLSDRAPALFRRHAGSHEEKRARKDRGQGQGDCRHRGVSALRAQAFRHPQGRRSGQTGSDVAD